MATKNDLQAESRRRGELGIHSICQFGLTVPDLKIAESFYSSFGLNLKAEGNNLVLRVGNENPHAACTITEGLRKSFRYISFGAFEDDMPRFKEKLERLGIKQLDPPPGIEADGLWFRDHDGNLMEIRAFEKTSPNSKAMFKSVSVPGGERGVLTRSETKKVRPRRLSHVLIFTTDVDRAINFYHEVLGLRLSDRSGNTLAFMHGIHGSDHHLFAFGKSSAPGFHHVSWGVDSIDEVGLGAMQMLDRGFGGWGLGRHVVGSNYFHYVRDPWGSWCEYSCDIDYIPADKDWEPGDYKAEDSIYLWGPAIPEDFVVNYEARAEQSVAR